MSSLYLCFVMILVSAFLTFARLGGKKSSLLTLALNLHPCLVSGPVLAAAVFARERSAAWYVAPRAGREFSRSTEISIGFHGRRGGMFRKYHNISVIPHAWLKRDMHNAIKSMAKQLDLNAPKLKRAFYSLFSINRVLDRSLKGFFKRDIVRDAKYKSIIHLELRKIYINIFRQREKIRREIELSC